MADLQMVLSEAVKLNQSISQFLKFSTYTDYDDLSGLDIDFSDGEQLLLLDELRRITDQLADVQEYISYLSRPVTEVSRLRKGVAGKYQTAKGHFYDCRSSIEALVTDEYHEVPYWTRTTVEHNGEDYYLVGYGLLFPWLGSLSSNYVYYILCRTENAPPELELSGTEWYTA